MQTRSYNIDEPDVSLFEEIFPRTLARELERTIFDPDTLYEMGYDAGRQGFTYSDYEYACTRYRFFKMGMADAIGDAGGES
jgi:hypothetical protein